MAVIAPTNVVNGYVNEDATPRMTTLTPAATNGATADTIAIANRLLLIFENTTAGAETVSIASNHDAFGRKADIAAFSIAASGFAAVILDRPGWEISGNIEITTSDAGILVTAINL